MKDKNKRNEGRNEDFKNTGPTGISHMKMAS